MQAVMVLISTSESIALFPAFPAPCQLCALWETELSKVLPPGWSPPLVLEGQGSHTWLVAAAGSISSQRKKQRRAFL